MAAIDVGTNSVRCTVVETDGVGGYRVLDDVMLTVRLGEGLRQSGSIGPAARERAREALVRIRKVLDGLGVSSYAAVATSAVRSASNGGEFISAMKRETGISIRTVAPEEEAELACLSVRRRFDMTGLRYAVADIGGGSVEIVTATGDHNEGICSLGLGAVFLTDTYLPRDPVAKRDLRRLRRHIRRELTRFVAVESIPHLVGSGGAMTTIGKVVMASRGEGCDSPHGCEVLHSDVVHLLSLLCRRNLEDRRAVPGLSPERADIIVAGVAVAEGLMSHFGAGVLRISEGGVREGLLLRVLGSHDPSWAASGLSLSSRAPRPRGPR